MQNVMMWNLDSYKLYKIGRHSAVWGNTDEKGNILNLLKPVVIYKKNYT